MNGFIGTGRALFIAAAVVGAVLVAECGGGDDNPGGNGGNNTGGNNTGVVDPTTVIKDSFTDSRDGRTYKTVKIGRYTWMAENLNIETADSWCYEDNSSNCSTYGRLYKWDAAKSACPIGWRLPSRDNWNVLMTAAGGSSVAGKVLKSQIGWNSNNGTDTYGFTALPAGLCDLNGQFEGVGARGLWWTATEQSNGNAYQQRMFYYRDYYMGEYIEDKGFGFSVRCIADD